MRQVWLEVRCNKMNSSKNYLLQIMVVQKRLLVVHWYQRKKDKVSAHSDELIIQVLLVTYRTDAKAQNEK